MAVMVGAHVALCAAAPGELSAVLPVTDLVLHTMEQTMVLMATLGVGQVWCHDNHCWNKQLVPYPGGLVNGKGGWLPGTQCETYGCGYCQFHYAMAQLGWGGSYSDNNYIPGTGGPSAWVQGGGCCYGQMGNPGMVRISYKQSEAGY